MTRLWYWLKMKLRFHFKCYPFKVFRYSFSEAIPIFFNRLKSVFFLVQSTETGWQEFIFPYKSFNFQQPLQLQLLKDRADNLQHELGGADVPLEWERDL